MITTICGHAGCVAGEPCKVPTATVGDAANQFHLDAAAEHVGTEHGKAAGSWVIDGNTSAERAQSIVDGYDAGDPAITDMQPSPLSGEWADGVTEDDVITEIADRAQVNLNTIDADTREELITAFEDSYSEGFWAEVLRAAKALLPATVRAVLAEAEYDPTTSSVVCVHSHYSGVDTLVFNDARLTDQQGEDPVHVGNYRALDAIEDFHMHRVGSPFSNADYFALELDGPAPEGLVEIIRGLENYPVLDESLMSEAEQELAEEHWDDYGRADARASLVAAVADVLNIEVVDVDLDDVFGDVDVDTLLNDRITGEDRYPEYIDPSAFEFHADAVAADVLADVRAWLTAEANHGQTELF